MTTQERLHNATKFLEQACRELQDASFELPHGVSNTLDFARDLLRVHLEELRRAVNHQSCETEELSREVSRLVAYNEKAKQ